MATGKRLKTEDGITPQEESMVFHVASGMPLRAAAAAAGFKFRDQKNGAQRIMAKPEVRAKLQALREEARRRSAITQDDVLEGFKEAVNDAKLAGDPQAQIAGWREIAKVLGFYAPEVKKVEVSHAAQDARRELSQLSEDDLLALVDDEEGVIDGEFKVLDS
jgi:phage terminase small subunit